MQKVTMEICLSLKGPILTQSSNPGELGLDMVVARHEDNTPYFPGTLIAGKLRQALEELDDIVHQERSGQASWFKLDINTWLGQHSDSSLPNAKQLYFSDFNLEETSKMKMATNLVRDRISIEEKTGAVKPRHIVVMENPFISGETYLFTGQVIFFSGKGRATSILKHIKTGFNWFSQLGAMKSIGFGQVLSVEFDNLQQVDIPSPSFSLYPTVETHIGLTIKPQYPFCLSGKPIADNLFESDAIIPGGAIIGSIAATWSHLLDKHNRRIGKDPERKELQKHFSKLRITHAFPGAINNKRPVVAPLSLVTVSNKQLYDVARLSAPCLIDNEPPDFSLDWKDNEDTLKEYPWPFIRMKNWGWASLNSELRVRTAIDREDHRSKKGELFAYEQIIPEGKHWYATLDLSGVIDEDRHAVFSQLKSLLTYGFIGLGKTKTPVDIVFDDEKMIEPVFTTSCAPERKKRWVITLQTDTLLGAPEKLNETSGESELHEMYQTAWEELSGNKLKLLRYFAQQKQAGGRYLKARFQHSHDKYYPWLLTNAGSVFVLEAMQEDATSINLVQGMIEKWSQSGLPIETKTRDYYKMDSTKELWEQCPYLPQNGYGEIAVNITVAGDVVVLENESSQITLIKLIAAQEEA